MHIFKKFSFPTFLLASLLFLNSCSTSPAKQKFQEILDVIGNNFTGGNFKLHDDPYFLAHPKWNIYSNQVLWEINQGPFEGMAADLKDFRISEDTAVSSYYTIHADAFMQNGDEANFDLWVDQDNILTMRVVLWGKFNHYIYLDLDERGESDEIISILSNEVAN